MIKLLESNGFKFKREGANHDIYYRDGAIQPVPRHREINEALAKEIIKRHGL